MNMFSLVGWLHNFIGRFAVALGLLTFAAVPVSAFTMTFDEFGACSSSVGTCSSTTAVDPTGLVAGNVLIFTLPSLTFTGNVNILEPDGVTISDRLRWIDANNSFTSCPSTGGVACANRMIFYSLDSNGAPADVGPLRLLATIEFATENANGTFSFVTPNGVNTYDGVSAAVPLPAALPLFASGLGALGLLGWRRKKKKQAV